MKVITVAIILSLASQSVFAQEVKYLEKGQTAPYTGFLFTPDLEKEFRLMDKKLEFNVELNVSYENLIKSYQGNEALQNKRIDICQAQNEKLAKPKSSLEGVGSFLLGVATTLLVAFAYKQVVR